MKNIINSLRCFFGWHEFAVRLRAAYDYRTEGEFLGWPNYWRFNGGVAIVWKFKQY